MTAMNSPAVVAIGLLLCGCASAAKEPAPPTPERRVSQAGGRVQADSAAVSDSATDDLAYNRMAIAAAGRIKLFIAPGRSIGMYQTNSPSPTFRGLVNTVMDEYGFIEVHPGDAKVACAPRPAGRSMRGAATAAATGPSCGLDIADVLVQFNSVQISRDTGYVGGLLTEVPRGMDKTRTTAFCILAARHGISWVGVKNTIVDAPRDCASDRKH